MGNGLRVQARRVVLQQVALTYQQASGPQKQATLEEFVTATGYAYKYAQWLLKHAEEVFAPPIALRRKYGPEIEAVLVLAWKTLNRICAKRLVPFLPDTLETLEKEGHVQLSKEHRDLLLSMSAATVDRLLQAHRYTHPHGASTTKAGPLLKQQIPVSTCAHWDEAKPGFLEAHCGGRLKGSCLSCSPLSERLFPRTGVPLPHVVSPALFEQFMRAGFSAQGQTPGAKRLLARDRALLWVLFDTGITVTELCALHIADVDQQTGLLRIRGKGGKERLLSLGITCQRALRSYLKQMDSATRSGLVRRQAGGDPLFGSQAKEPLTKNGVTMVCARFRKRAGISETAISPQVLRHSFALRYLRAGGNPRGLQELFGL